MGHGHGHEVMQFYGVLMVSLIFLETSFSLNPIVLYMDGKLMNRGFFWYILKQFWDFHLAIRFSSPVCPVPPLKTIKFFFQPLLPY